MKKEIERIVTFCCSKYVHIYYKNCGVLPHPPYKAHNSIDKAKKYLKERGIRGKIETIKNKPDK